MAKKIQFHNVGLEASLFIDDSGNIQIRIGNGQLLLEGFNAIINERNE